MTYIAYLRQSTKKQAVSGLGIEAQREIIHNYLRDQTPIADFVETESGRHNDRPKLTEALALCRKTNSTLIVAKLDRLSRNVAFTSKLLESDVEIKFCDFPEANKLVLHIIASIAEYEAQLISTRTKQSLDAKKARGMALTVPHNERRRDDVSSMVLLIGLLAGARVRNRRATESPRLFLLSPFQEVGGTNHRKHYESSLVLWPSATAFRTTSSAPACSALKRS